VTVGRNAVIDCQADASPPARIEWRLSQGKLAPPFGGCSRRRKWAARAPGPNQVWLSPFLAPSGARARPLHCSPAMLRANLLKLRLAISDKLRLLMT